MIRSLGKLLPSVPVSPPLVASKAGECNVCDSIAIIPAQKLSNADSVSCNCEALDESESRSVFTVYEDEDDWEFAGDEEREDEEASAETGQYLSGAITVPNLLQLSMPLPAEGRPSISGGSDFSSSTLDARTEIAGSLDEEIGETSVCDWLEPPPLSGTCAMQERQCQVGDGVMLEAFQQFQHNPQVQKMVVALATDAGVWRAVLANKKLQEYKLHDAEIAGDSEVGITQDFNSFTPQRRMVSNFVLLSHNAVRELKEGLWDQIGGIIDAFGQQLQAEIRQLVIDVVLRVFMMMTLFLLTLIAVLCLLPLQASQDA